MRDGGDHREDACPELQSGSEGDDTEDEDEADEESEGRIRSTEMECEGQLVEGCSQKELIRSGEAHPLLARSDDADFLPFRSAGATVPMGLAVKKPVYGLKGCERSCHERPAHEGGYFQYCGRTHGREAVMRELELQKEATPEQAGGNGRRVCALEGCQSFCHARPAKEGGGEYLYCRQIRMDGWRTC